MKVRVLGPGAVGSIALGMFLTCTGCASSPPAHPLLAAAPPASSVSATVAATPTPVSDTTMAAPPPTTPAPAPGAARTDDERASMGTPDSEHHDRQMRRAVGWISFGAGALSTTVAVATSFMMMHQASLRAADCTGNVCSLAGFNADQQLKGFAPWNTGAWIIGVVGLGVGVVLLATNPSDASKGVQVSVAPSGALLQGAF